MAGIGFIPVGGMDGRPYNGATQRCVVLGAVTDNIHIGDCVLLGGTGDASGVPDVTKCAATNVIFGVVVAVEPTTANSLPYAAGSVTTDQYVHVAVGTDAMLFKGKVSAAVAKTSVGLLADIVVADGAAPYYTSQSTWNAGATGTSTASFQLVGFLQDGVDVTDANKICIFRLAEPQIGQTLTSVGV